MKGSVRKRGNYYEYSFEIGRTVDKNGKVKRKRKSKSGFKTKKECELALIQAISDFETSGRVISENKISVDEYLQYWYDNYVCKSCRYNTQYTYRNFIKNHISPFLGSYYLNQLTPAIIQSFLDSLFDKGLSKKTLESIFKVLKLSLDMSVYPYEFLKDNPSKYVKIKYKFKDPKINRISLGDAKKVLIYLKENYYFNFYIAYLIFLHTGLRRGECLGLQWENIDFENRIIKVRHQALYAKGKIELVECKTASSVADILMTETLFNELLSYKHFIDCKKLNHNFVCINTEYRPMTFINLSYIVERISIDLNIHANPHAFRHCHAQLMLDNNIPIKAIQNRMRHSNVTTTLQNYVTSSEKLDKNTVDVIESVL